MKKYTNIPTLEEITKGIEDLFCGKSYTQMKKEHIPYIRKLGDNSWEIFSGYNTLRCNDAGKALFDKALLEQGFKVPEDGE